jgi:hypothetical protein
MRVWLGFYEGEKTELSDMIATDYALMSENVLID